jgi:hypothetical protein
MANETKTGSIHIRPGLVHRSPAMNLLLSTKKRGSADDLFEPRDMSDFTSPNHPLARSLELGPASMIPSPPGSPQASPGRSSPIAAAAATVGSPPRTISQQFVGLVKRSFSGGCTSFRRLSSSQMSFC